MCAALYFTDASASTKQAAPDTYLGLTAKQWHGRAVSRTKERNRLRADVRMLTRHIRNMRVLLKKQTEKNAHRQVVVRRLQTGLRGFPLASQAAELEAAGYRHNVSPYFMAAASGVESTFGQAPCGNNPRNIWGLGACGSAWQEPYFDTWEEAFDYYARFLRRTWPRATTAYHYYGYSACDSCWGRKTAYYMSHFFGSSSSTAYPRP
jgi:hypothetical protein